MQIGAVAGAVAGFSEARATNAHTRRVTGALRDAERARGLALADAGHAAARRNTRSACLGIAAGIQRHGWDADLLEPASRVIALLFKAAAVRLCPGAAAEAPDARVIIIRAHVLQTALGTGLLQTMAGLARLHHRRVTTATGVINTICEALRSALSVAMTNMAMSNSSIASQGRRNGGTDVSLAVSPSTLGSTSSDAPSHDVEAASNAATSATVAVAGIAHGSTTGAMPTVDSVAQAPDLAAAAATAAAFLLGEAVTEAAVCIDHAVNGLPHFASKAASAASGGQSLLLRSILELSEVMQIWPRARDGRAAQFRGALRILRAASPTDSRVADAFESDAARLAQFRAPPRVTMQATLTMPVITARLAAALQASDSSAAPGGAAAGRSDPSPTIGTVMELQPIADRQFGDSRLAAPAQPLEIRDPSEAHDGNVRVTDLSVTGAAPSA